MRLLLEIVSGPDAGRKAWLREGQVLEVGRTDLAAFAVPHDGRMSGRHFSVRCDRRGCQLRDLGSRNGTTVNGERVTETILRDRDAIVAGGTRFVVQLQGADVPPVAGPRPNTPLPAVAAAPRAAAPAASAAKSVGHWVCKAVPTAWRSEDLGLRLVVSDSFPSSLVLTELPAPADVTLDRFVHAQVEEFAKSLGRAEIEGPVHARIEGAEEAMLFTLRHPPQNGFILVQRYLYARRESLFGMAVLTTSYSDLQRNASEFERLLAGLVFHK